MSEEGFTGNRKAQNVERNLDKVRDAQIRADRLEIIGQPAGRRLLYRLIFEMCHVESISYRSSTSVTDTAFYEGERNIGITMMAELIDNHPDQYMEMIQEHLLDRKEELLKRKEARAPNPKYIPDGDNE